MGRIEAAVESDLQPRPASETAANARSTSARSSDSGFSQKIALPDDAAATSISTCVSVLVQMATASISSLARTSSTDSATGTASDPATALAATGSTSYTTPSAAPSTWWASSSACIRPMRPTPRTPTRTVSSPPSPMASQARAPNVSPVPSAGPLRVAVVGLGRMGRFHLDVLDDVGAIDVVALAEPADGALAAAAASRPSAATYREVAAALTHPDLEACIVASPTATHTAVVEAALGCGLHVMCEKPLALDPADADRLGRMAEAEGLVLQVGFWRRFSPPWSAAKAAIDAGQIGRPLFLRLAQWDADAPPASFCDPAVSGGLAIDCGVHEYDLAEWLTGRRVTGCGRGRCRSSTRQSAPPATSTTSLAVLRLDDGAMATVDLSRNARFGDDVRTEALGSAGAVFVDLLPTGRARLGDATGVHELPDSAAGDAMAAGVAGQAAAFAARVRGGDVERPRGRRQRPRHADRTGRDRVGSHGRTRSNCEPRRDPPGRRRDVPRRQRRLRRAVAARDDHLRVGDGAVPVVHRDRRAGGGRSDARPRRAPHADVGEGALPLAAAHRAAGLGGSHRRDRPPVAATSASVRRHADPDAVEAELRAQIERALAAGIDVTHLDAHMGAALAPELGDLYLRLADEHHLPVLLTGSLGAYGPGDHLAGATDDEYAPLVDAARSAGRPIFDEVRETPWSRRRDEPARSTYESMFADLPDGLTFMALHPNAPGELEAIEPATAHIRTAEYELFRGDDWAAWLAAQSFEPVGMRALATADSAGAGNARRGSVGAGRLDERFDGLDRQRPGPLVGAPTRGPHHRQQAPVVADDRCAGIPAAHVGDDVERRAGVLAVAVDVRRSDRRPTAHVDRLGAQHVVVAGGDHRDRLRVAVRPARHRLGIEAVHAQDGGVERGVDRYDDSDVLAAIEADDDVVLAGHGVGHGRHQLVTDDDAESHIRRRSTPGGGDRDDRTSRVGLVLAPSHATAPTAATPATSIRPTRLLGAEVLDFGNVRAQKPI